MNKIIGLVGDRIAIRKGEEPEEQDFGGIILPEAMINNVRIGTAVSISKDLDTEQEINVDDLILYNKGEYLEIEVNREPLLILFSRDIIAVVK